VNNYWLYSCIKVITQYMIYNINTSRKKTVVLYLTRLNWRRQNKQIIKSIFAKDNICNFVPNSNGLRRWINKHCAVFVLFTFNLVTLSLFSFVWCVLLLYVSVPPTGVIKIDWLIDWYRIWEHIQNQQRVCVSPISILRTRCFRRPFAAMKCVVSHYTWLVDGGAAKQFKKDWLHLHRCVHMHNAHLNHLAHRQHITPVSPLSRCRIACAKQLLRLPDSL